MISTSLLYAFLGSWEKILAIFVHCTQSTGTLPPDVATDTDHPTHA